MKRYVCVLVVLSVLCVLGVSPVLAGTTTREVGNGVWRCYETFTNAPVSMTLAPTHTVNGFTLQQVRMHCSVDNTNALTVHLDSGSGAAYDTTLKSVSVSGTDAVWMVDPPERFSDDDAITVLFTPSNTATIGVEAVYQAH